MLVPRRKDCNLLLTIKKRESKSRKKECPFVDSLEYSAALYLGLCPAFESSQYPSIREPGSKWFPGLPERLGMEQGGVDSGPGL
jgi:hypothetical protein